MRSTPAAHNPHPPMLAIGAVRHEVDRWEAHLGEAAGQVVPTEPPEVAQLRAELAATQLQLQRS